MDDCGETITMDNLLNNPDLDFLSQFNNHIPELDPEPSPYDNIVTQCKYYDESSFLSEFKGSSNRFFLSLNIQSLPSKFNEFEDFVKTLCRNNCAPDFICLQETWKIIDPSLYDIDGYNFAFLSRSNNVQGGGVGIYVRKGVHFTVLKLMTMI